MKTGYLTEAALDEMILSVRQRLELWMDDLVGDQAQDEKRETPTQKIAMLEQELEFTKRKLAESNATQAPLYCPKCDRLVHEFCCECGHQLAKAVVS